MADIELVIKISEEQYNTIKSDLYNTFSAEMKEWGLEAIKNGIVLPKGHGRLGDLDTLEKEIVNGIKAGLYEEGYEEYSHINDIDDCVECIKYADTIIEADKESEE